MAFLLAILGRVRLARTHIDQALKIRKQLGRKYPIALSKNTRGLILVLEDHPMWGEGECREALQMCEELGDPRGIGLAHLGLGLALRKRGNQWKMDVVYSQEDAGSYFRDAKRQLEEAAESGFGLVEMAGVQEGATEDDDEIDVVRIELEGPGDDFERRVDVAFLGIRFRERLESRFRVGFQL